MHSSFSDLHRFCWEVICVLSLFLWIWRVFNSMATFSSFTTKCLSLVLVFTFFFFPPCIYSAWGLLYFWNPWLDVFYQFWKILSHYVKSLAKVLHGIAALGVHFVWPSGLGDEGGCLNWHLPLRKAHALANSLQSHT